VKILYLTAGAAGMYCGSCLRDNALATELLARGHDVTLVPLYTPTRTDEPNVSQEKVFFGGISVYLQQHSALFRKTPRALDRLWDSGFALRAASRRSIPVDPQLLGELTVSILRGEEGRQQKELFKLLDWMREQDAPEVVDLQNSMLIGLAGPVRRALGRPVCCTLQGEDTFLDGLKEPYHSTALGLIREKVRDVDAFISVSAAYADYMAEYLRVPRAKIHVVPLGINFKDYPQTREAGDGPFTIGFFTRVAPEKGLHILAEAYRRLRARPDFGPARLEAAGYLAPEHQEYLRGVERQMRDWGLGDEFRYHGELDREAKLRFLSGLDVMSVPATHNESKGISVLEAMACGVPVVEPRRGSFPEFVERAGGGLLVEPEDPEALAAGILELRQDPELARRLGLRGHEGVRRHYSVARMAEAALETYQAVVHQPTPEAQSVGQ